MLIRIIAATGCCLLLAASTSPARAPEARGAIRPVLQYVHVANPRAISFARNAPRLALAGDHGMLDIWNTQTWERLRSFDADGGRMTPMDQVAMGALSPDGRTWACVTYRNQILLWDTETGAFLRQLSAPGGPPNNTGPDATVAWTRDGRRLFTNNGMARLWDARSGRLLRTFPGQGAGALSPDGKTVATALMDTVALYEAETGNKRITLKDSSGVSEPIAFSPDGKFIATSGEDPNWNPDPLPEGMAPTEAYYAHQLKIKIWDRRTGRRLRMLPGFPNVGGGPQSLSYTADGKRLLLGFGNEGYRVIDARTGHADSGSSYDGSACLAPDGRSVLYCGRSAELRSAATGRRLKTLPAGPYPVAALSFSPDGARLASSDWLGERLWDVEHGRLLRPLPESQPETADVFYLPNGNLVSEDLNSTWLYNGRTGVRMKRIPAPRMRVSSRAFGPAAWQRLLPDGRAFLVGSMNDLPNHAEVRDIATGRMLVTIPMGDADLADAVISQDGRLLTVSAPFPKPGVTVWDLSTGKNIATFKEMRMALAFSPDGQTVLGIRAAPDPGEDHKIPTDETMGLWSVGSGQPVAEMTLPARGKLPAAFAPNGRTVAVGVATSLRLLDGKTMAPLGELKQGDATVTALTFSPDGKRLAVGDAEGRIRLWDVTAPKLLVTMVGFPTRDGSKVSPDWFAESPDGFFALPDSAAPLIRFQMDGNLYPAAAFEKTLRKTDLLGR